MRLGWAAQLTILVTFSASLVARADQPAGPNPPTESPAASAAAPEGAPPAPSRTPPAQPAEDPLATPTVAPRDALEPMVIREPSQGRPIFVTPDSEFFFVMRLTRPLTGSDVSFSLVHAKEPSVRFPLWATTPPSFVNNEFASLVLKASADVVPGLYDLEVRSQSAAYRSVHSVRIVDQFPSKFRCIHLSNMNVGDLTAPDFDDRLPDEVNLLAPEFIIATGDFTEWSRARKDAASWSSVLNYLARFDAPVFVVCGLHDHEESFADLVASSPIGTIEFGDYHGLLLLDHPGHPIDQDFDQLRWIDSDLQKNRNRTFNFLVMHSDELGLLDAWRERGNLARFLDRNRIRMIITGGSTDWDFTEFKEKLSGLDNLHFIRTHQSSTCLRDRASGVSHYRVIEVDGEKISYIYPDDTATENLQHSVPTGKLRVFYDRENDGRAEHLVATVQNGLNQAFEAARLWLRVQKSGTTPPTVAGGRLVRALDAGAYWACDVAVNLPDKGAVRVMAASSPGQVPPPVPVTGTWNGPTELTFTPRETKFGLRYAASRAAASITLKNESNGIISCWPIVRLNGAQLRVDPKRSPTLPLTIKAGESVELPLVLNLRRVSDGAHLVQLHFLEDPLTRLTTFPVTLRTDVVDDTPTSQPAHDSAAAQVIGG
ncbi:MAG: hypothetical protein L6Q92_00630 [Phycisphaerae bacterium]|nr:hypothetical protein [Phycisphaerae bacterium]